MNNLPPRIQYIQTSLAKQQGGALLMTMIFLLISMTLLTVTNTNTSISNTRLTFNILDKDRSALAADSATSYAWKDIQENYKLEKYVENTGNSGNYDLREAAQKAADGANFQTPSKVKTANTWKSAFKTSSWSWNDASKHLSLPNKMKLEGISYSGLNNENPMQLAIAPQYIKGIGDPVMRHGTESYYCMPISVLGAAQGGSEKSRTLVEIKVVPKKGCFRSIVK